MTKGFLSRWHRWSEKKTVNQNQKVWIQNHPIQFECVSNLPDSCLSKCRSCIVIDNQIDFFQMNSPQWG